MFFVPVKPPVNVRGRLRVSVLPLPETVAVAVFRLHCEFDNGPAAPKFTGPDHAVPASLTIQNRPSAR